MRSLGPLVLLLFFAAGASALEEPKPTDTGTPFRVGADVSRPEKLSGESPVYSQLARSAGLMGTVIVESIIDETGRVTNVEVLKNLPLGLDRAAVKSVLTWKFKPAIFEGRPVKVYYVVTVNFQIEGDTLLEGAVKKLLSKEPGLAEKLQGKSRSEAREILARWQGGRLDPAYIPYLLFGIFLEQGRLQESLEEMLTYRGREMYGDLWRAGAIAWNRLYRDHDLTGTARAEIIELDLQLEERALEAQADGFEALVFKALLLLDKRQITSDPSARDALLQEVERLRRRTIELRPKTAEEELIREP